MTPARRTAVLRPLQGAPPAADRLGEALGRLLPPWGVVLPAAALAGIGLAALLVVSRAPLRIEIDPWATWRGPFGRQCAYLAAAAAAFLTAAAVPASTWRRWAAPAYAAAVVGLVAVLFAPPVRGVRAWIDLGPVALQVSEFAKVAVVLLLARLLAAPSATERPTHALAAAVVVVGLPVLLVLKEPDLGTAVVLAALLVAAPYAAGLPTTVLTIAVVSTGILVGRILLEIAQTRLGVLPAGGVAERLLLDGSLAALVALAGLAAGCVAALVARRLRRAEGEGGGWAAFLAAAAPAVAYWLSFAISARLKEYQRLRLLTFLAPQVDPQGAGYNVLQSQIAVGSGGLVGKGITGASQSALGFLPEASTDFIFAVVAEAFGLAGGLATIALYAAFLLAVVGVARRSADLFGAVAAASIAAVLGVHALVNVGMALGVMPVMGIPLPLLSYGGSSLVATAWALGVVASIHSESVRTG